MFYEDPLGLLKLSVLPLVAPSQVVHVEQHHLERKKISRKKKEKKNLKKEKRKKGKGYLDGSGHPGLLLHSAVLL